MEEYIVAIHLHTGPLLKKVRQIVFLWLNEREINIWYSASLFRYSTTKRNGLKSAATVSGVVVYILQIYSHQDYTLLLIVIT